MFLHSEKEVYQELVKMDLKVLIKKKHVGIKKI